MTPASTRMLRFMALVSAAVRLLPRGAQAFHGAAQAFSLPAGGSLGIGHRSIRLPPRAATAPDHDDVASPAASPRISVTGTVYTGGLPTDDASPPPTVTLFTKDGCTLCERVELTLQSIRHTHPHTLLRQDITDPDATEWWDRYKYDIPVLHVNGQYWIKHRITMPQAQQGLEEARLGQFVAPPGEPNAKAQERTQKGQ